MHNRTRFIDVAQNKLGSWRGRNEGVCCTSSLKKITVHAVGRARDFSLLHRVQTGLEARSVSCTMGIKTFSPGGKGALCEAGYQPQSNTENNNTYIPTWPPLWSSGHSSWLQIQRCGFDFRRCQIFWVVDLEGVPHSFVGTTEELLGRNSSGSSLESREYGRGDPLRWPCDTLYPQKLALTLPTNRGRSVSTWKTVA
jgi:hypothetical protein